MTTTNPPRPQPAPAAAARAAQPSGPSIASPGLPPIDPVKIVLKYMPLLIAVGVISVALGVGVFLVWRKAEPVYRSSVTFEAQGVRTSTTETSAREDDKELDRFMNSQAADMASRLVIDAVLNNPRTRIDAPDWASRFSDGGTFDVRAARKDLSSRVSAGALSRTKYIQLNVDYSKPTDAYVLAGLLREEYLKSLKGRTDRSAYNQRDDLSQRLTELTQQEENLKRRRNDLLTSGDIDDLQTNTSAAQREIEASQNQLTRIKLMIEDSQSRLGQYRAQLEASPGGIAYPDSLRSDVENDPELRNIRQTITGLEAEMGALRQAGLGPNHRTFKAIQARIDSWNQELESKRQELLRSRFDGLVDAIALQLDGLRAQEADLLQSMESAKREKTEMTQILSQVRDLNEEIGLTAQSKNAARNRLDEYRVLIGLDDAARIIVARSEQLPDSMHSPKPLVVVPATMVVLLGLTTGLIFLREVLDQRVKGPSDITSLQRMRLVGVIPDADEDPEKHENLALAYQNKDKSVLAESFRQTRASLARRMNAAGHRSIAIVPAMPGSGATTIATNLAACCAKSDMKVVLIDANFRKPRLHSIFGLAEGPGLGDVLADPSMGIEAAMQATSIPNLSVVTAGSAGNRSSERLSTAAFGDLITNATATADLVIVDAPPGVVSGDGRAIANRVDSSMLVVRAMSESRGLVSRLRNEFSDCRGEFLGVLVNGVKAAAGGYLKRNIEATHKYANSSEA